MATRDITLGSENVFQSSSITSIKDSCSIGDGKVVVLYADSSSNTLYLKVLAWDGSAWNNGDSVSISTYSLAANASLIKADNNKVAVVYYYSSRIRINVCAITGTTITVGSQTSVASTSAYIIDGCMLSTDIIMIAWSYSGATGNSKCVICSISGTSPSFGTIVNVSGSDRKLSSLNIACLDSARALLTFSDNTNLYAQVASISGTSISWGTYDHSWAVGSGGSSLSLTKIDTDTSICAYFSGTAYSKASIINTTGTSISGNTNISSSLTDRYSPSSIRISSANNNHFLHSVYNGTPYLQGCDIDGSTVNVGSNVSSQAIDSMCEIPGYDNLYAIFYFSTTGKARTVSIEYNMAFIPKIIIF